MTTEQPTELEDIDGFFLRGEPDDTAAVLADGPVGLGLDEETDTVAPPSAAQLERRARLRRLVTAIVAPLGVVSAVVLAPRALSLHVGARSSAASDAPQPSAAVAAQPVTPTASEPKIDEVRLGPDPAKLAEPSAVVAKNAPAAAASPKTARVALHHPPREAPAPLARPSLPPETAPRLQAPVTPSHGTGASASLPTARFPTSATN